MNPTPTLGPQELTQLAHYLNNQGMMALQAGGSTRAHIMFAQCLYVLKEIGNNDDFISQVLFSLGQSVIYYGEKQQAIACCEAAVNIQKRQGKGEPEADCFYAAGSWIANLEDYPKAFKIFYEALKIYENIGAIEKTNMTKKELDQLSGRIESAEQPDGPLEFAIYVESQMLDKFTISSEGEVKWHYLTGFNQPLALGTERPWQVVCTKFPYRRISF